MHESLGQLAVTKGLTHLRTQQQEQNAQNRAGSKPMKTKWIQERMKRFGDKAKSRE